MYVLLGFLSSSIMDVSVVVSADFIAHFMLLATFSIVQSCRSATHDPLNAGFSSSGVSVRASVVRIFVSWNPISLYAGFSFVYACRLTMQWSGWASISVSNSKVCWSCVHIARGRVVWAVCFWLSSSASSVLNVCSLGLAGRASTCSCNILASFWSESFSLSSASIMSLLTFSSFCFKFFVRAHHSSLYVRHSVWALSRGIAPWDVPFLLNMCIRSDESMSPVMLVTSCAAMSLSGLTVSRCMCILLANVCFVFSWVWNRASGFSSVRRGSMYCRRILVRINSSISARVIPSSGSCSSWVHSGFHVMRYVFSDVGDVWVLCS